MFVRTAGWGVVGRKVGDYQAVTLFEWNEENAPLTESQLRACQSDKHKWEEWEDIKENGTLKPESQDWMLVINATH